MCIHIHIYIAICEAYITWLYMCHIITCDAVCIAVYVSPIESCNTCIAYMLCVSQLYRYMRCIYYMTLYVSHLAIDMYRTKILHTYMYSYVWCICYMTLFVSHLAIDIYCTKILHTYMRCIYYMTLYVSHLATDIYCTEKVHTYMYRYMWCIYYMTLYALYVSHLAIDKYRTKTFLESSGYRTHPLKTSGCRPRLTQIGEIGK